MHLLNLARQFARDGAAERRNLEMELEMLWRCTEKVALSYVETVELLEGFLDSLGTDQNHEVREALQVAVRRAWEALRTTAVQVDGQEGEVFDPSRHRAIKKVEVPEGREGRVERLIARGVLCAGRRFRPAEVIVGRKAR